MEQHTEHGWAIAAWAKEIGVGLFLLASGMWAKRRESQRQMFIEIKDDMKAVRSDVKGMRDKLDRAYTKADNAHLQLEDHKAAERPHAGIVARLDSLERRQP